MQVSPRDVAIVIVVSPSVPVSRNIIMIRKMRIVVEIFV